MPQIIYNQITHSMCVYIYILYCSLNIIIENIY
jgi:hypothetical protein